MITYTLLAAIVLILVFVFELLVLKTGLVALTSFWIAYGIVAFFQILTNGYLTGLNIVTYNPEVITGTRINYAPIEDLFFGFALVSLSLFIWTKLGPSKKINN